MSRAAAIRSPGRKSLSGTHPFSLREGVIRGCANAQSGSRAQFKDLFFALWNER